MSVENLIKNKRQKYKESSSGIEMKFSREENKKDIIFQKVRQRISENKELFLVSADQDITIIRNNIWRAIEDETEIHRKRWSLSSYERSEILEQLMNLMFGYGILEPLINDSSVTEIMVNGLDRIYIEKDGCIQRSLDRRGNPLKFNSYEEQIQVIEKIVSPLNRKINESEPIVDARLPNGSRVNVVLQPIALDGSTLTIRKFPENPYTMGQLVEFGTLSEELAEWLEKLVKAKYNILISGGTGSGKTTFLNALSMGIPTDARIITIEDAAELKLAQAENIIRLETRPSNIEGKGEINIRDLVRTALRMRPDRIVVGEVRAGEALDMLQAMNTGHDGSLSTGHANSAVDMLSRLETMVLMGGVELPIQAIRQQVASSIDIIVHLKKIKGGARKVTEVIEILDVSNMEVRTKALYKLDETTMRLTATGESLTSREKLDNYNS